MPWKDWSAERVGVVLAMLAALGFSLKAIFVKLAYATAPVDAVTLLSLRMIFALPAFLWVGFVVSRSAPPLRRQDWLAVLLLGLLGYYGASMLDFLGLQYISAGLERLILFTYPTLTLLIAVLWMGKRLGWREIASLLLSYAGIALAFAHDLRVAGESDGVLVGAAFVLASSLCYAIYVAGSGPAIARLGAARFTALAMLVSTLATQLHFLATRPLSALLQPLPVLLYGVAMAIVSTVVPAFMQSSAVRRIGPERMVLIGTLGPMLTIFFGWLVLDEPLSPAQLAGAALVLAGVLLAGRG